MMKQNQQNQQNQQYQRWLMKKILHALQHRRVLLLVGARQVGKTTMVRRFTIGESDQKGLGSMPTLYRSLDNVGMLKSAIEDPHGFVQHAEELMVIDEVQRAPELLQAVKQDVDENTDPGRFLLTGSADIHALPNIKESLAGRVRKLRLRVLTEGEIHGVQPDFLEKLYRDGSLSNIFRFQENGVALMKKDYIYLAIRGGYPEVLRSSNKEARQWHLDYVSALIDRDLRDISNIKRVDKVRQLIFLLAGWSSKLMNVSEMSSVLSISRDTLDAYINVLESMFLIDRLKAWEPSDYKRALKKEKIFMTDTGLMSSLCRWTLSGVEHDGDKNGKLIETFVYNYLASLVEVSDHDYSLSYYRDREKREIDFIVENENGDIVGIEVKAGSAVDKNSFKHLRWFDKNLSGSRKFLGIVLYTGQAVLPFGDRMWAVPISALWAE